MTDVANNNNIRFSATRLQHLEGSYNTETGELSALGVDAQAFAIQNGGNLTEAEREQFQQALADNGIDLEGMTDRVAARADEETRTTRTTTNEPPEGYAEGRYTEASSDADLREGFRGERVRNFQQELADAGYDLGEHGVDGFWGPDTQAAYEKYLADGGESPRAERQISRDERPADEVADDLHEDFNETHMLDPTPDTDDISSTLENLDNEQVQDVDREMRENHDTTLSDEIEDMDENFLGINDPFAIAGDNEDYKDLMQEMARGERNEGDRASADPALVDAYADKLLGARNQPGFGWMPEGLNGTNEEAINDVFGRASDEQLRALDRQFRAGITDEDGNVTQFDDGLEGYINAEIEGFGFGSDHRDALLLRLNRARGE